MTPSPPTVPARPLLNGHTINGAAVPMIRFVNETEGGTGDFAAIQAEKGIACAQQRLCAICGTPLQYWIAFLGGARCAEQRIYLDPPMHPACAEARWLSAHT
jgi:hypothetical protein